jgi:hypothetical protein
MIAASGLEAAVQARAAAMFDRLGEVEAAIHQVPVEQIHFHEVGAIDSIVDIVGTAWAMEQLHVARVVSSPLNVGSGTVATAHGRLPVPAPATLRLLEGVPTYAEGSPMERVTPTGALLVTSYAGAFGAMPPMTIRAAGYGAGGREVPDRPNVLRAVLGDASADATDDGADERVVVVEANVDDMNPQIFAVVMDRLFAAGALDVFFTPVQMKKNRPATLLTAIAPVARRAAVVDTLLRETSTIGVRYQEWMRECLARETVPVTTAYGAVRMKVARRGAEIMNASPEFDDCVQRSLESRVPVKDVLADAIRAYRAGRAEKE